MGLHNLVFLFCQAPGLVQDGVRNGDFAHIVHDGGHGNVYGLAGGNVFRKLRFCEHEERDVVYAPDMLSGLTVAKFYGRRQGSDKTVVQFDNLLRLTQKLLLLFLHLVGKVLSHDKEFDNALHAAQDYVGNNWLSYDVHDAQLVGLAQNVAVGFACDEEDRNGIGEFKSVQLVQDLKTAFLRHNHIEQKQAVSVRLQKNLLQSLLSIFRLLNRVVGRKDVFQYLPADVAVIHNKRRGSCLCCHGLPCL